MTATGPASGDCQRPAEPAGPFWRRLGLWLCLLVAAMVVAVVAAGTASDVYLGDEAFHYRLARTMAETGHRPAHDPLLHWTPFSKRPIITDTLWHTLLAAVGALVGGVSQFAAQVYNAGFFVLLAAGVYGLARHLYDARVAAAATVIALGVPMAGALSVILHFDVAVAALGVLTILAALKKRIVLTGVLLGLSLLMKRNMYFLVPQVFLLVCLPDYTAAVALAKHPLATLRRNVWRWLGRAALVAGVAAAMQAPDWYFRAKHFGLEFISPIYPSSASIKPLPMPSAPDSLPPMQTYDESNPRHNPLSILTYLGASLLIGVGAYVAAARGRRRDWPMLMVAAIGLVLYLLMGRTTGWMLRYMMILTPYLAILAARGICARRRWMPYVATIVLLGAAAQFALACHRVVQARRIPPPLARTYDYINENLPADAVLLTGQCPQAVLYTGRRAQWHTPYCYLELPKMLWQADQAWALKVMERYGTTHLLVNHGRIYDDSQRRHLGGYPASFVEKMKRWPNVQKVHEEDGFSLWEIRKPR